MDAVWHISSQSQVWSNQTIQHAYCNADDVGQCFGLCPNPDISGLGALNGLTTLSSPNGSSSASSTGVRTAFYLQLLLHGGLDMSWFSPLDTDFCMPRAPKHTLPRGRCNQRLVFNRREQECTSFSCSIADNTSSCSSWPLWSFPPSTQSHNVTSPFTTPPWSSTSPHYPQYPA